MANRAIIAVAGSGKTQQIVEEALARPDKRILVTTFTVSNLQEIEDRFILLNGRMPSNVTLRSWFSLLIQDGVKPYQADVFGEARYVLGFAFFGRPPRGTSTSTPRKYFANPKREIYRDQLAALVVRTNADSDGAVLRRLESQFDVLMIDEFQDLIGWDLEVIDLMFGSRIETILVGDPRQYGIETHHTTKHPNYRGAGVLKWLEQRTDGCELVWNSESRRCGEAICSFASELFPEMEALHHKNDRSDPHLGVFLVRESDVDEYVREYQLHALRYSKSANTHGVVAQNIGVAKGRTFRRVLLFPTATMLKYLEDRDTEAFKSREHLYIAATRAMLSFAVVVPDAKVELLEERFKEQVWVPSNSAK